MPLDLRLIRDHADAGGGSYNPKRVVDEDVRLLIHEIEQLRGRVAVYERAEANLGAMASGVKFTKSKPPSAQYAEGYKQCALDILKAIMQYEDETGIERPIDNGY